MHLRTMINLSDFEVKGSKIKVISLNQIKIFWRIGETCFFAKIPSDCSVRDFNAVTHYHVLF